MGDFKFVPDSAGIQELLKSAEVAQFVTEIGQKVAKRAGDGFEVTTQPGKLRTVVMVDAGTKEARRKCYKDNILLKALHK